MEGVFALFIVGAVIVSIFLVPYINKSKAKQAFELAKSHNNFNPDYVSDNRAIAIESKSKKVMLKKSTGDYQIYNPEEISAWSTGHDTVTFGADLKSRF